MSLFLTELTVEEDGWQVRNDGGACQYGLMAFCVLGAVRVFPNRALPPNNLSTGGTLGGGRSGRPLESLETSPYELGFCAWPGPVLCVQIGQAGKAASIFPFYTYGTSW
jgi:hypothetical protein